MSAAEAARDLAGQLEGSPFGAWSEAGPSAASSFWRR